MKWERHCSRSLFRFLGFSSPLTLTATTTVKAIALKNGLNSSVATKVFTKSDGGWDGDTE